MLVPLSDRGSSLFPVVGGLERSPPPIGRYPPLPHAKRVELSSKPGRVPAPERGNCRCSFAPPVTALADVKVACPRGVRVTEVSG
jgi:hypothetical protein